MICLRTIVFIFIVAFFSSSTLLSAPKKFTTEEDFKAIYQSIVKIESIVPEDARTARTLGTERLGNGVIIDNNYILTIGYIVAEAETINITMANGSKVPGELVGYDHSTGFGILKTVLPSKLKGLSIGNSDQISKEEKLFVLPSLSAGMPSVANMVSRRSFAGWWEYFLDKPIYTYPMNSSFAGTPLVNEYGEIVGIGSLYVQDAVLPGVVSPGNLFVPINELKPILDDLIKNGKRTKNIKPYMGLTSNDSLGFVTVTRVNENGPAAKAGFLENDTILTVNKKTISNIEDFYKTVWSLGGPGSKLTFQIQRGEKKMDLELTTMDRNDFLVKPKYY